MSSPWPVQADCGCAWDEQGLQIRHCGYDRAITYGERESHLRDVTRNLALQLLLQRNAKGTV